MIHERRRPGPFSFFFLLFFPERSQNSSFTAQVTPTCRSIRLKLENEDWCLTSALINILMMLSKALQKTFLYSIDTLWPGNWWKPCVFPPPPVHAIYLPSAARAAPQGSWSEELWLISWKLTHRVPHSSNDVTFCAQSATLNFPTRCNTINNTYLDKNKTLSALF